jgi:hypothetical protein
MPTFALPRKSQFRSRLPRRVRVVRIKSYEELAEGMGERHKKT